VNFQAKNFDVIIRKVSESLHAEEYRVITLYKDVEADELLSHPEILEIINERVVQISKIDALRWRLMINCGP
jgi:hypothetical protein